MENLKIGEKIKSKRKELEYTQEELANILYVTKAAVSKWENGESYPDITLLPKIAQLFNITIDELFDYKLEYKPLKIVNEFHFGISLNNVDKEILNHGTVKSCKVARNNGEWDTLIEFISNEEDFPYTLQKCLKRRVFIDGYSIRLADGKVYRDKKPNKHYVCKEKVWEYHVSDSKYIDNMFKELLELEYIDEEGERIL